LDERADVKSGVQTAGAGRQDKGRLGKVEVSQVGAFLALANEAARFWTWIDGEVFLPEHGFAPERAKRRQHLGIPPARQFAMTIALGWQMIQRVRGAGLPVEAVRCDEVYGRSRWLRAQWDAPSGTRPVGRARWDAAGGTRPVGRGQWDAARLRSVAQAPAETPLYLTPPAFGRPAKAPEMTGRAFTQPRLLDATPPVLASQVATWPDTDSRG